MKTKRHWFCIVLITVSGPMVVAQQPGGDPLGNLLIPPEVLLHHRQEIGLSEAQVQKIRARLETAERQVQKVQQRANFAMKHLVELLSTDEVDEQASLKQLDDFLAIEKKQKRLHLRLMIHIRNELTAKQRQVATKIGRTATRNKGLEQRLKIKLSRIEKEVQSRAEVGQPPFDVVELMQKFPKLMQNGQVRQAEALLDRVITMLGLPQPNDGANTQKPGQPPARLAEKIQQRYSAEDVRAEFTALKKEDVAWRGIQWKTCLLEGLKASREQNKPIMLWIFIDRPVDDERC